MPSPKPDQKTVLITGCTPGGIGHALAVEFHARGLHVIATARNPVVLIEMADAGITTLPLDVTHSNSIAECHKKVGEITGGKLDILVNNAGRTHTIPATDIEMDDVRATFETNVFSVMAMCQAFADQLIAAKGLIINIASLAAITPYVFGSVYCASKGAVVAYSRTMRQELAPFGVRVLIGMTGTVNSNIASHTHRSLPANSIYQRVADLFTWRLTYSQNQATVNTKDYARRLVSDALAPEVPVFLRRWFGRPDWSWAGGLADAVWLGTWIGEWFLDVIFYRLFGMKMLADMLKQEQTKKKLT